MATYIPPTEDFSYPNSFNPIVFRSADDSISIAEGDTRYLRFPVSQGSETIAGNLTITGEAFCATVPSGNTALANKLYVDNAVIGGSILGTNNTWTGTNAFNTSLPTSTLTPSSGTDLTTKTYVDSASVSLLGSNNTWTGTNAFGTLSAGASTLTSVITNAITGTAVGTAVSLYDEALRTGTVSIATGTGTRSVNIGGSASSTSILGSTCDMGGGSTTTAVNIANNGLFAGTVNIANASNQVKTINIGNLTTTTLNLIGSTITATKMAIAGVLSAGASTLTSVQTNTIAGTAMTIQPITSLLIGTTSSIPITIGSTNTLALNGSAITAPLMTIAGALSAGASTLASVITNTITGTTMSIQPTAQLNLADSLTSGSINIGRQDTTATTTTVNLAIGNGQTGAIGIGTGTGTKTITIGNDTATTTALRGSTITATRMAITNALSAGASTLTSVITNTITGTAVGTAVSLYGESSRSGIIEIGNGSSRSGDIRIGSGATTSGAVLIGRNGGGVSIGTSGSTNTIDGTTNFDNGTHTVFGITNINTTGSNLTTLGNASASTQIGGAFGVTGATTLSSTVAVTGNATFNGNITLGNAAADEITPTGTVKVPFTIGYASWSNSATTNVTTYLGGTLQTSKAQTAVGTNTFSYMMSSVTPYSAGGGVTLTGGTYMFWMGINMEDSSAFDVTDIRMGLTTTSTLSNASTEADFVGGLPNLTCYFHKTDTATSSSGDSENRVLSGCFYNGSSSAVYYPFYYVNNNATGGIDSFDTDVIIVKIGGGV